MTYLMATLYFKLSQSLNK